MHFIFVENMAPSEDIFINYSQSWEEAWREHMDQPYLQPNNATDLRFLWPHYPLPPAFFLFSSLLAILSQCHIDGQHRGSCEKCTGIPKCGMKFKDNPVHCSQK